MVVGRIPYLNCEPFQLAFAGTPFRFVDAPPRRLGQLADEGVVDAGLMASADFFRLDDRFALAGPYCIAARREVRSVLLLSTRPADALHDAEIVLTDDSSTSALLLRLVLEQAHGVRRPRYVRAADRSDEHTPDARLVIGDDALRARASGFPSYPYVMDLAFEWWQWTALPMVFAVWTVRTSAPPAERAHLRDALEASLLQFGAGADARIAAQHAPALGMTQDDTLAYLRLLTYRLGDAEAQGLAAFRSRLETLPDVAGIARPLSR